MAFAPPGWPAQVPPPDAPEFPRKAVAWLLDLCPPDYRGHDVLKRHPAILARFAAHHVAATLIGTREAYSRARAELRDVAPPEAIAAALRALEHEGIHLVGAQREIALVEEALRGKRWRPQLG
jgi:hypothetical protein